jgi:PEGA domain-containing protein
MRTRNLLISLCTAAVLCPAFAQIVLPEGTRVRVRLDQSLSSATAEEGQSVNLSVTDDVKVGDSVVIAQGATCVGTIVKAVPKRRLGRAGKLDFAIERVVSVDGSSIPLRYSPTKKEGGSEAVKSGVLAGAAAVVFWPAAPVFLLMHGKDVTINKGIVVEVFTDQRFVLTQKAAVMPPAGSSTLQPMGEAGTAVAGPAAASGPLGSPSAVMAVRSEPDGAEVELDGAFIGNTPASLKLAPGPHSLVVKKGSASWTRTIHIQPGSTVTVIAPLGPKK